MAASVPTFGWFGRTRRRIRPTPWTPRAKRPLTILDLDYREVFWSDPAEASAQVRKPPPDCTAVKIGKPVFRAAANQARGHIVSDCPLAAQHIVQQVGEMAARDGNDQKVREPEHPIEIIARAYGLLED